MAIDQAVILPAKKLTGVTGFVYTNAAKNWTGVPIRSSDTPELPIAWTTYQQALYDGITEAAYIAARVQVLPAISYGVQNTLLRKPRMVLYNFDAFTSFNAANVFGPITARLEAAHVIVAENVVAYESGFNTIFRQFLPHFAENSINDNGVVGAFTHTIPQVLDTDWVGGQILYLDALSMLDPSSISGGGPGAIEDQSTGDFQEYTNANAFETAQITTCLNRYEKFGHHLVYCLADVVDFSGGADPFGLRPQFQAVVANAVLAATGSSLTVLDGSYPGAPATVFVSPADVEAEYRNKVIDFFDL